MTIPIQQSEKISAAGSETVWKQSLITRVLRWIYPERRVIVRQPGPPVVAYLGAARSSLAYGIGDISAAGFYMLTRERWLVGTEMPVTLHRTDLGSVLLTDAVTAFSRVIRVGSEGVAFAFVLPLNDEAETEIAQPGCWANRRELNQFLDGLKLSDPREHDLERAS